MNGFRTDGVTSPFEGIASGRGIRVAAIALSLAALVVGSNYESRVAFATLLVAVLVGGAVGVKTRTRDSYLLFGNAMIGSVAALVLAWLLIGVLPVAYFDLSLADVLTVMLYRVAGTGFPVLFAFYVGVFGGTAASAYSVSFAPRRGVTAVVVGLAVYAGSHVLLLSLRPDLGTQTIRVLGAKSDLVLLYNVLKVLGGVTAFVGVVALADLRPYRQVLVAAVVVTAAFAGAGVVTAHETYTTSLVASDVEAEVSTTVTDVAVAERTLQVTATVENPTAHEFRITAGFLRVYSGADQLAYGALSIEGAEAVEVGAGEEVTIEYTMRLSPDQRDQVQDALEADGATLRGRHGVAVADGETAISFTAQVG